VLRIREEEKMTRQLLCLCLLAFSMQGAAQHVLRVMHLNVENLFDCRHDSLKQDYDFLPTGLYKWTWQRYYKKLNHLAQTIAGVGDGHLPDLVSLCEVENDSVMYCLTHRSALKQSGYEYVVTHSPDLRGVDVALLYQPGSFKPLMRDSLRIPSHTVGRRPTRDILHVAGLVLTGDTLDVFVCHLPSRAGGRSASEPHRFLAARLLRAGIDSVMRRRFRPHVLVLGDFNDFPDSPSIANVLGAHLPPGAEVPSPADTTGRYGQGAALPTDSLYDLMAGHKRGANGSPGTYRYKGEWNVLDHAVVNGLLLDGRQALHTDYAACRIMDLDFLLQKDNRYGASSPFRTFIGPRYTGGYSDHLPIVVDFSMAF
jgi:endonuclease/exonuclease/phosphatase family metal-dependent hydrolase